MRLTQLDVLEYALQGAYTERGIGGGFLTEDGFVWRH